MNTKRWLTAVVAGAALAAPASAAAAAPTPAPVAIHGSGTVSATQYSISVNAGPFGEDPTGTLSLTGAATATGWCGS
jgi:opacity protein-like surface antigen